MHLRFLYTVAPVTLPTLKNLPFEAHSVRKCASTKFALSGK